MPPPGVSYRARSLSTKSATSSREPQSACHTAPVIPMATDPTLTDIRRTAPQGLLHAQRRSREEDITGALEKSHEVSDDRTWLPNYDEYDDAKVEDEVDVDYEEIDDEELEDGDEEVIQDQGGATDFIFLQSLDSGKRTSDSFTDFEQVTATNSAIQPVSDAIQEEPSKALPDRVSGYDLGGALGKGAKNARSVVDPSACTGPQAQAQKLAGDLVDSLRDATQERRPTQVSYSQSIGKPRHEFKAARGCTPGILKPSVFQPPSDETTESSSTDDDWSTVRSED